MSVVTRVHDFRSELTASQYEDISEETLDALTAAFEELGETEVAGDDYDVQYAVRN